MRKYIRTALAICCQLLITHCVCAQGTATTMNDVPKMTASVETKPTAFPIGKEVTITIKNSSELPVNIFAGPREGVRAPSVKPIGGRSVNKLYLHENEVVCLLTKEAKPTSCAVIKPGVTTIVVDESATKVIGK